MRTASKGDIKNAVITQRSSSIDLDAIGLVTIRPPLLKLRQSRTRGGRHSPLHHLCQPVDHASTRFGFHCPNEMRHGPVPGSRSEISTTKERNEHEYSRTFWSAGPATIGRSIAF